MINKGNRTIRVLDCTLRDGGYVNNWMFGRDAKRDILSSLEKTGIDIVEIGFLRDQAEDEDSSNIHCIESANEFIQPKKPNVIYSAMLEAFDPYPLEKLSEWRPEGIDLIRVCIWKRKMKEHLEYCKQVKEKGYALSIQPSRVEQYSQEEFIELIQAANELNPFSFYVVDTWGTQSSTQIMKFIRLAEEHLKPGTIIGYHGHNNMMQALGCAEAILNMPLNHELSFDASLLGMGRGAGNLNTEILLRYLNERFGERYNTLAAVDVIARTINPIHEIRPWGYSLYYYLSACYGCNPNYASYFQEKKYSCSRFQKFLNMLTEQEKIIFNPKFVENKLFEFGI